MVVRRELERSNGIIWLRVLVPSAWPRIETLRDAVRFLAVRAFRRYRMLMVTLERIGISNPATYAAAARLASRMSPPDPAREFLAIAQFQGALALLERMRVVGTLDAAKTERSTRKSAGDGGVRPALRVPGASSPGGDAGRPPRS